MSFTNYSCAIAVFLYREKKKYFEKTLTSLFNSLPENSVVDLLVNGNKQLEIEITDWLVSEFFLEKNIKIRVWSILLANKANAWNQYVQNICPSTCSAFFMDGYVMSNKNMFDIAISCLQNNQQAMCVTGLPNVGDYVNEQRKIMVAQGGLHGNFFCLGQNIMEEIRKRNIRLPVGLYGFDTVLGGFLGYGFNPKNNTWDIKNRVLVPDGLIWQVEKKQWWKLKDILTHFKRIKNNALRALVRKATIFYLTESKRLPESLPETIDTYINEWARAKPDELKQVFTQSPLSWLVYRELQSQKDWASANHLPKLIYCYTTKI